MAFISFVATNNVQAAENEGIIQNVQLKRKLLLEGMHMYLYRSVDNHLDIVRLNGKLKKTAAKYYIVMENVR